jgi:enediyne biosynthesis protein E4
MTRSTLLRLALCAVMPALPATAAEDLPLTPVFTEETATAGITSSYTGEWQYMVGGGATSFDCSGDGFPDVLLAGGSTPATFYRNTSTVGGPLTFAAETSGLELDAVTGAYAVDADSDGIEDVFLLRVGENFAMRGLGGCKFERANETWGFDGGDAWSTAFAATWEKGNAWPTVAVGNYIDRLEEAFPWGSCTDNWLHRPAAAGAAGFAAPLALKPSFCPLSMLFTDWNHSGTPSLRVSNDREYYKGGQEQMWRVDPGADPALYTVEDGWRFLRIWGMGIASRDLNADGYPEYFLTSMADSKLQTLAEPPADGSAPKPGYADVAFKKGAIAQRPYVGDDLRPSTGWHAQFEDMNNDGLADLFVAKGNVAEMPDFAQNDPNNLLVQKSDGSFAEMGDKAGVASMAISRGAAVADFNLDGRVDLIVTNRWQSAQVWRNTTEGTGNWIEVRLSQPAPNGDAIGAWLEVRVGDRVQRREITVGGGHVGGHLGWWHLGVGASATADIRVTWPDGTQGDWQPVKANAFYIAARDAAPQEWVPQAP